MCLRRFLRALKAFKLVAGQIIDANSCPKFPSTAIPAKRTRKSRLGGCRKAWDET